MNRKAGAKVAEDFNEYVSDPKTRLPRRLTLRQITQLVREAHVQAGGASVHPHFGNLKGQALFAVSLFPERTARIMGREIPSALLAAFTRQNADLFQDTRLVLGTWYNADEDTTYLDITAVFIRRQEAVSRAEAYNQIAVYDLAQEVEISIGGTGEELPDMPPENRRLPPFRRGEE